MTVRLGRAVAFALALVGCNQKAAPKVDLKKEAPAPAPFKFPTLEESIVQTGKKEGKAQWDIDCDLAFVGNLSAARSAQEVLVRLPYSQQSQRSQACEMIVRTTINRGGYK